MLHNRPDWRLYGLSWCTDYTLGAKLWPVLRYVNRVSISISQCLNAILGGEAHETLSSRTWRYLVLTSTQLPICGCWPIRSWPALLLAGVLERFEHEHCRLAHIQAKRRARFLQID